MNRRMIVAKQYRKVVKCLAVFLTLGTVLQYLLQWRHNGRHGVSNPQPPNCLPVWRKMFPFDDVITWYPPPFSTGYNLSACRTSVTNKMLLALFSLFITRQGFLSSLCWQIQTWHLVCITSDCRDPEIYSFGRWYTLRHHILGKPGGNMFPNLGLSKMTTITVHIITFINRWTTLYITITQYIKNRNAD